MKSSSLSIPRVIHKSFLYTLKDRRKLISIVIVVTLPVLGSLWRFVPEDSTIIYYESLRTFVYLFVVNFAIVLIAVAWFLTIPRRDFAMQIIATAAIFYGIYLILDTIPQKEESPFWIDILVSSVIFFIVSIYLYYVHRNYINSKIDHKQLYDGIVHDLHHEKLLNSVSRVQGLMNVAELEEPYRSMCQEEIKKIREAVAYVTEKYNELN